MIITITTIEESSSLVMHWFCVSACAYWSWEWTNRMRSNRNPCNFRSNTKHFWSNTKLYLDGFVERGVFLVALDGVDLQPFAHRLHLGRLFVQEGLGLLFSPERVVQFIADAVEPADWHHGEHLYSTAVQRKETTECDRFGKPRKYAFLLCGQQDLGSVVTAQNDEFKGSFHSLYLRLVTSKLSQETQSLASILSDTFVKCICRNISCALGKWSLQSRWNFISTFTELHVHGDERWPTEVTPIRISAVSHACGKNSPGQNRLATKWGTKGMENRILWSEVG